MQTLVSLLFASLSYQFSLAGFFLGGCLRSSYQTLDLVTQLAVAFLNFFLLRTHVNHFSEVRAWSNYCIGLLRLSGLFWSIGVLTALVLASFAVTHLGPISLQWLHVGLNLGSFVASLCTFVCHLGQLRVKAHCFLNVSVIVLTLELYDLTSILFQPSDQVVLIVFIKFFDLGHCLF